jgi:hypothetical protein
MTSAPYKLLGWNHPHPDDGIPYLVSGYRGPGNYNPRNGSVRTSDIHTALSMAVLHHMGFEVKTPIDVARFVNQGLDIAVDYFHGGWWTTDKQTGPLADKDSPSFNARQWLNPFHEGLLLGLLSGRWDSVAQLCSWIEPKVWPFRGEPSTHQLYMSIAASLRPAPLSGLDQIETEMEKVRDRRVKLWIKSWFAGRAGDQAAFDKAVKESLAHYEKSYATDAAESIPATVAIIPSTIVLAVRRLGLQFPSGLSERQTALLVTRASLGFDAR